ncbi:MAG TPA: ATP phosphoribosyltransferase [Sediminispirochaeta sp.]|nr:ATP phosphoribosyltransferase [Sediminispirochaeta sp.]
MSSRNATTAHNTDTAAVQEGPLTLALPKGRLFDQVQDFFLKKGLHFKFESRKLVAHDESGLLKIFLVKNADLPTYVHHGIAGLGICGEDVLFEEGKRFFRLRKFDFGSTSMCLAAKKGYTAPKKSRSLTVATKFPKFTLDYFHRRGHPIELIKLNGSVELAPILGLAPYIVDLVETGSTLKANNLEVVEVLQTIVVQLIANPSYYKLNYRRINQLLDMLNSHSKEERE